jgi:anthranilate phosphoribosyltransferase
LSWPCYAGKAKTFRAVPAAAILLSRLGVDACLHTYDDSPGRQGTGELLDVLGVRHLPVDRFHPRLYALLELRKELGVRSITNVAARLAIAADRHFISISHAPYFEKYQAALDDLGERGVIALGSEGEPEAPYHGVLKLLRVPGGQEVHRPEDYGLRRPRIEEIPAGTVEEEAAISRRVLAGDDLPHRTIVVMTTAAALSAAADVPFSEAIGCALKALTWSSSTPASTAPR